MFDRQPFALPCIAGSGMGGRSRTRDVPGSRARDPRSRLHAFFSPAVLAGDSAQREPLFLGAISLLLVTSEGVQVAFLVTALDLEADTQAVPRTEPSLLARGAICAPPGAQAPMGTGRIDTLFEPARRRLAAEEKRT